MFRLSVAVTGLAVLLALPASGQGTREMAGTLTCTTEDAPSPPPTAVRHMECSFEPAGQAPVRNFRGTIRKWVGEGVPPGRQVIRWSVMAPSGRITAEALQGRYASAPVETVPSVGRVLLGGANGEIALQPLTPGFQVGVDVAQTVVDLELAPVRA